MTLFGANCTAQQFNYHYRVPENGRMLNQMIESGFNRQIGDNNLSRIAIDDMIERGKQYGMVEYEKLEAAMTDGVQVSIIFRRNEPVPAGVIQDVVARNRKDLTAVGKRRRTDLAIAAARTLDPANPEQSDHVSISIEEAEEGTMSREGGGRIEEGYVGPENQLVKTGMVKGGKNRGRR